MAIPINEDPYSRALTSWHSHDDLEPPTPNYRPKSLEAICQLTKFSKREVQIIYRSFKQGCPNGIVNLAQFREIYSHFFPQGNSRRYAEYVFMTFDRDGDHQISFEEFVIGLSVITRGSLEEKIDWIFNLYDITKRGRIGQPELLAVTQSIYELLGRNVDPPISSRQILEHVLEVYHRLCRNGETSIDHEQFAKLCKENQELCDSLILFDTIL